jgi:L-alanine-DL-glutamate epimerase-like enolase superfamily enzyme
VELVEQPLARANWLGFSYLAARTNHVPFVLDESIVLDADIERAARAGADCVKLKLFKHRGVRRLLSLAERARELGMCTVLGNGVASDIGNLIEAAAFIQSGLIAGAFEGNGFAKLPHPLLKHPPRIASGQMIWDHPAEQRLAEMVDYDRLVLIESKGLREG